MKKSLINKLKRLKVVTFFLRLIAPGFSTCNICGLPWKYCTEKSIWVQGTGHFATCQYCWNKSGLNEIKHAYEISYISYLKHWVDFVDKELLFAKIEEEYHNETRRKQKLKTLIKRTKRNQN